MVVSEGLQKARAYLNQDWQLNVPSEGHEGNLGSQLSVH